MPKDLPGFYYDLEKNRYFPIKGPIPGSAFKSSSSRIQKLSQSKPDQPKSKFNICWRKGIKTANLLQLRELYGKVLTSDKWKCNFQEEYQKIQVSQPMIWKYEKTDRIADSALEHFYVDVQTPKGQNATNVLLTGSMNGSLSLYEDGKVGQHFDYGVKCMPDCVWPLTMENQAKSSTTPGNIWGSPGSSVLMPSHISCIKRTVKHSHTDDGGSSIQRALITTLGMGTGTCGASIYMLNLCEPLDLGPNTPILRGRIDEVALLKCTIWTADCNSDGTRAVIGTNLGAALINLETGVPSWVCRSKSDVFSQQFDQTGNVVLCGFRNGAIVTVDIRQKQERFSDQLPNHRMLCPSHNIRETPSRKLRNLTKQWFKLKGNINLSCTIYMPSSISSLVSLQSYDQYFLASSMDGSIKLYDHRLTQRGAVQSYEGNVNSHTHIQLGVDPSERFVMSGGEDCNIRIWSIRTGEMLFGKKISNSVPSTICWPGAEKLQSLSKKSRNYADSVYDQNYSWGAWFGSREGLFFMHGS